MTLDEKHHISQWRTPTFIIKRTIMALMKVNNKSFSKAEFKAVIGVQNPAAAEALLPRQKKRKNNL